jgi:hypothetical protein
MVSEYEDLYELGRKSARGVRVDAVPSEEVAVPAGYRRAVR